MYTRGYLQSQIADRLGVHKGTVCRAIQRQVKQWQETACEQIGKQKSDILRGLYSQFPKIDRVEREAWDAWERSQKPTETTEAETVNNPDADSRSRAKRVVKSTSGESPYLNAVLACVQQRREVWQQICKILGLNPGDTYNQQFNQQFNQINLQADAVDGATEDRRSRLAAIAVRLGAGDLVIDVASEPAAGGAAAIAVAPDGAGADCQRQEIAG